MSRLFYTFTLVFLFFNYAIAVPLSIGGAAKALQAVEKFKQPITPIYRTGGKNDVVGGAVRPNDFKMEGGMVHPDGQQGLSFNKNKPDLADVKKSQAVHSIKPYELKGTDFAAVHDGNKNGNPAGHVSLTYKGETPVSPADLKTKLNALPFTKEKGTKK
jgi:hypothetical protein